MTDEAVIDMLREAFIVALKLAGPLLLVSLGIGLVISLIMAATQIQEMTLTFVPKFIIVGLSLILLAPWMISVMRDYITAHFDKIIAFMR